MFENGKFYVAKFEKVSYEQFVGDVINKNGDYFRKKIGLNEEWFNSLEPKTTISNVKCCMKNMMSLTLDSSYQKIILPKRATTGSAGYDLFMPFDVTIKPGESIVIPTGIRCKFEVDNFVLKIYPKSGLGFKYSMGLANTVGIIDSDYYYSDNEGHIMIKLTNYNHDKNIYIDQGKSFAQGIFEIYGLTIDDDNDDKQVRNGGFGSTSK